MRPPPLLPLFLAIVAACASPSTGTRADTGTSPTTPTVEIPKGPYTPGQSYFGRENYIEYIAGSMPVIITAPHGGTLAPSSIPDRTTGTTARDLNTDLLAREIANTFFQRTGRWPHVIITHLSRRKVDTNRDILEAAQGNPAAERAWKEFHLFVEAARTEVQRQYPHGFYVDLHGHGHDIQRLELGYLLSNSQLDVADAALDASTSREAESSIRTFSVRSPLTFSQLLRGPRSLGALFEEQGFPAVPSPKSPSPGADPYFDGGYNTARYSCSDGSVVCGVQLEANFAGVRDTAASRTMFALALLRVLDAYLAEHVGLPLL